MISQVLLAILFGFAILQDVTYGKIKNSFQLISLGVSFFCVICVREVSVRDALAGIFCSFIIGFFLWRLSAIRAGDAKFMWTIGVLKGLKGFLFSILCSILAGGIIAIIMILIKKKEFPFTIPMAIGCAIEFILYI